MAELFFPGDFPKTAKKKILWIGHKLYFFKILLFFQKQQKENN